ncbi:MAG TPA: undecaprenyl-diphosphate phosphatase [Candidatus Dojkabacteria bacterium]|nr:undecaprenyl-diphosphate phosphatase [Candidatus Dojkabacteria bacterium]
MGFISSFIASLLSIKLLLKILNTNVFIYFGIYRILLGIIILIWM